MAFPLVSAGIYGWPKDDAIAAAIETLRSADTSVEEARLVAFDGSTYDAIRAVARRLGRRWRPPCRTDSSAGVAPLRQYEGVGTLTVDGPAG